MKNKHEVIFCIVNAGFSEEVMDAARQVGARGGTVLHASGTANSSAEKLFGITIQPEKDIVMILVSHDIKDDVLHSIYNSVGLKSAGQGIAFALPVDSVVGLSDFKTIQKPADQVAETPIDDATVEKVTETPTQD